MPHHRRSWRSVYSLHTGISCESLSALSFTYNIYIQEKKTDFLVYEMQFYRAASYVRKFFLYIYICFNLRARMYMFSWIYSNNACVI